MFTSFGTMAIFTSFGPLQDALRRRQFRSVDEVKASACDRLAQQTILPRNLCLSCRLEETCRRWWGLHWRLMSLHSVFAINNFIYSFRFSFEWPLYVDNVHTYEGCPESIRPFRISREPAAWHSCNLAASQRRPYCASVNSHSPVGLVSRQWDAVDLACLLCDRRIHNLLTFNGDFRFEKSQKSQGAGSGL
jgi:hypothetical protein